MVAWDVTDELVEQAGMDFAALPMVSHCYERNRVPGKWRYNLFTMVHGSSEDDLQSFLERGKLSRLTRISRCCAASRSSRRWG